MRWVSSWPGQLAIGLGVDVLEGEVLELPLDLPDAQALGQGRVDLGGLLGDALLLIGRQRPERTHVVEAVGQLDEDDSDVVSHGQEHLADVLRLLLLMTEGAELAQLGDTVDEAGHIGTEALLDITQRVLGVLGHVVQDGGRDRHRIESQLGQDPGHRQRVADVGLAADAPLLAVRFDREGEGGRERGDVRLRVACVQLLLDRSSVRCMPAGEKSSRLAAGRVACRAGPCRGPQRSWSWLGWSSWNECSERVPGP